MEEAECLVAGPTIPEGLNDKNKMLSMKDTTGSDDWAIVEKRKLSVKSHPVIER